jgi:hypothetical protein
VAKSNVIPLDRSQNYRKTDAVPAQASGADVSIMVDGDEGVVNFDQDTNTTQIALEDGDVVISFGPPQKPKGKADFDSNLADYLLESELSTLAERLLLGIESDMQSRAAWLENMSNGISLLGLEIKQPRGATVAGTTPTEGVSVVDHPLLLEAVLRFQANARGELLPTDGPVKVKVDGESNALSERLAQALEKDLNHYLTKTAKEYYPDTDRMLLMLGFSGISFKKGYHDPIKRRPVIASIDAKDLIVSNTATDIDGAGRITHRVMMKPSLLRRMQLVGAYRDIDLLEQGLPGIKNPIEAKIDQIQGIAPPSYADNKDQDRELYECYCEIEVPGFEHEMNGKETGLPLPFKIVIDKDSRRILEIRRNWEEDDPFCMPRNRIIAYIFIPGLGFYGIGLLNILGNATKAVTASWRLLIDAGMFSTFPGFLYVKTLAKQLTNQFRVPPGGGQPIDTAGQDIRSAVMPLPYKDPNAVFIQLIENIAQTAQRVGGTAELQIGEGKQDAPVGTTLAMIEQATKLISAVHKRLHQAQGQEFDMLRSMLMEDPTALWRHNKKSKVLEVLKSECGLDPITSAQDQAEERHRELFLAALGECELIPRADPNTSSQTERYLKIVAMRQMAMTNPALDKNAIDTRALQVMGIDSPEEFFIPPQPPTALPPNPQAISAQANMITAQARITDSQNSAQKSQAEIQLNNAQLQLKQQELASKEKIASLDVARSMLVHNDEHTHQQQSLAADNYHQNADRMSQHVQQQQDHSHASGIVQLNNQTSLGVAQQNAADQVRQQAHDLALDAAQRGHEAGVLGQEQQHEAGLAQQEQIHQHTQGVLDRQHQMAVAKAAPRVMPGKKPAKKKK